MADSEKELIDRIKAEGQLTRNTGTNSIKSINSRLDKFSVVFSSIETNLMQQTKMMEDTLKLQLESNETSKRMEQLAKLNREQSPQGNPSPSPIPPSNAPDAAKKGIFSMLGGILASFPTGFMATAGGLTALKMSPFTFARFLVRGGLLLSIAPLIGEFVGDFVGQTLSNFEFDQETVNNIVPTAERTAMFGAFGAALGKRFIIPGMLAGLASSLSEELLTMMGFTEEEMQRQVDLFGQEISIDDLTGTGLAVGSLVAYKLFRSKLLTNVSRLRLGVAGAVLGIYMAYGDEAKEYLSDNVGLPSGFADMAVDGLAFAATGASLGRMFGPIGMIAGAAIGLAVGFGWNLYDWMVDARDRTTDKFLNELDDLSDVLDRAASGEEIPEEERRRLAIQASEGQRLGQTLRPQEDLDAIAQVTEEARQALAAQPLKPEGVSRDQLDRRVELALSGDSQAMSELLDWARANEEMRGSISRWWNPDSESYVQDLLDGLILTNPNLLMDQNAMSEWTRIIENAMSETPIIENVMPETPIATNQVPIFPTTFAEQELPEVNLPSLYENNPFLNNLEEYEMGKYGRLLNEIERAATESERPTTVLVNAPTTYGPRYTNVQGGTNVQSNSVYGGGGGSLNHGLPGNAK